MIWDKALRIYETLINLCATNPDIDEFEVTLRFATCCLKIGRSEDAYKSFTIAKSMKGDVFEVNTNLGLLEYKKKNYEKAVTLLNQAKSQKPDDQQTLRTLGHAFFKTRKFKEAGIHLRKAIDIEPEDKESIFSMAQCYHELGQHENAIQIFTHLRPDPVWGPSAALFAGTIHLNNKETEKAIMDFEIGLKHKEIKPEVKLELMYRLATAYLKNQDINKSLELLRTIYNINQDYKDVASLLRQYQELQTNRNLQVYLLAQTSDFLTICRKLTESIYDDAKVKIVDISVVRNEYADILAEVHAKKWEDLVLFRFIRTKGTVGELVLRDMYARTKELRAGRGYCFSAGDFSDEAKVFVEARLIDLFEKSALTQKLKNLKTLN
jgi:tetratricopeptide (TPR) repeat protein